MNPCNQNKEEIFPVGSNHKDLSSILHDNEQLLYHAVESMAFSSAALAQYLETEANKLQKAIDIADTIEDLLKINCSVNKAIDKTVLLEYTNYLKLDALYGLCSNVHTDSPDSDESDVPRLDDTYDPEATCPTVCTNPSPCTKTSFFEAPAYQWVCGSTMRLRQDLICNKGIVLYRKNCETYILLPAGKKFLIEYEIELVNKQYDSVSVDLQLCYGNGLTHTENIFACAEQYRMKSKDIFIADNRSCSKKGTASIWLHAPSSVKICKGCIHITEV